MTQRKSREQKVTRKVSRSAAQDQALPRERGDCGVGRDYLISRVRGGWEGNLTPTALSPYMLVRITHTKTVYAVITCSHGLLNFLESERT